jgi:hypothetical protein
MEKPVFLKIPGADFGEIPIGSLVCFAYSCPADKSHFNRSEFTNSVEKYITSDQQKTVQYFEANENTTDDVVFDQIIRAEADLVIVSFLRRVEPHILGLFCKDLKAIAKQFRVRILASVKIQKEVDLSLRDLPIEMQESADILLLGATENSRRVISIAKGRDAT